MSELIVRMKMPRHCNECACFYGGICFANIDPNIEAVLPYDTLIDRPSWCPIIGELPEQHGRLVDADTVVFATPNDPMGEVPPMLVTVDDLIESYDVPTIVPATERRNR